MLSVVSRSLCNTCIEFYFCIPRYIGYLCIPLSDIEFLLILQKILRVCIITSDVYACSFSRGSASTPSKREAPSPIGGQTGKQNFYYEFMK